MGNNMFAYCLNNPVSFIDCNGELALPPFVYSAIASGLVSFISTFATTGSLWEGVEAGLWSIASSLGDHFVGWIGTAIDIYLYGELLVDCLSKGLSWEECFLVLGITLVGDISLPGTGDEMLDNIVTATFGTGKGLVTVGITTGLQEYFQSDEIIYIPRNPIPSTIKNSGKTGHRGGTSSTPLYKAFGY